MNLTNDLKSSAGKEPSKRFKTIYLITTIVSSIFLAIGATVGILWQFGYIGGPKLAAVVDCGSWRKPSCIEFILNNTISPHMSVDTNEFLKVRSMFHIFVSNKRGYVAKGIEAEIPDAFYAEVVKNGDPNGFSKLPNTDYVRCQLGNIKSGDDIEINAWTTEEPNRKLSGKIKITHDTGNPVHPYVKTPVGALAECVNRYTIWILLAASVLGITIFLLHIFKFCWKKPTLSPTGS